MQHRINVSLLILLLLINACSDRNDFDSIIANEYEKCTSTYVIDFSKSMALEWDTMYYFSGANSLSDINRELGFKYEEYVDIGPKVIFVKKGKVVYSKDWFPNPSAELEGAVFNTDLKILKMDRSNAKFKVRKVGKAYFLEKVTTPHS